MLASFASTEVPSKRGIKVTSAEAEKALPCPSCIVWNKSRRWNAGLLPTSCMSNLVKQASFVHGIVGGGMVCRNAASWDLESINGGI